MKIQIKSLIPSNPLPKQGTPGAAGWDVHSPSTYTLRKGDPVLIPLGFAAKIPEGYYATIVPRSSLGIKGITICNAPGTIDSDYTGQWHIGLINHGPFKEFTINSGDRIGQIIVQKYEPIEWVPVERLEVTERGDGGFGSTGR